MSLLTFSFEGDTKCLTIFFIKRSRFTKMKTKKIKEKDENENRRREFTEL
jgi:hypothetical protein